MTKTDLARIAGEFIEASPRNTVAEEIALDGECAGLRIFSEPLLRFGAADDPLFERLKQPGVVGEHLILPREWLPAARTVVSVFLPYTERVRAGNAQDYGWPSNGWLHGRIEGQQCVAALLERLQASLADAGFDCVVPMLDPRFKGSNRSFTSNWSERHAAFVCGAGTFGLSRGLITKKGVCGRFGSVITSLKLDPDEREYSGVYEYCSMCGACARHCPAHAITLENGKEHAPCARFIDETEKKHKPRYGCGKCQVRVPCESGIPLKRAEAGA